MDQSVKLDISDLLDIKFLLKMEILKNPETESPLFNHVLYQKISLMIEHEKEIRRQNMLAEEYLTWIKNVKICEENGEELVEKEMILHSNFRLIIKEIEKQNKKTQ